jgi:hypothetical protein
MSTPDPSHPGPARRRRAKKPFDAKTRRRLDRPLAARKPVPDPVPDPSALVYRSWSVDRTPTQLHRIVCERLRGRWSWVRDALVFWDGQRLEEMRAATTRVLGLTRVSDVASREDEIRAYPFAALPGDRLTHSPEHHILRPRIAGAQMKIRNMEPDYGAQGR